MGRCTTLDFFAVLIGWHDIVAENPELKFRDRQWNRCVGYRQLASRDISFFRLRWNGHFRACNTSVTLPILNQCRVRMPQTFSLIFVFLSVYVEGSQQGENSVAPTNVFMNFDYEYFCFEVFFRKFFFWYFFSNFFFQNFLFKTLIFFLGSCPRGPKVYTAKWPLYVSLL